MSRPDRPLRILYTHRTQGVGAEGAHILGMYEAFAELGHEVEMLCLPGCNPALAEASGERSPAGPAAGGPAPGRPGPSLVKRAYWFLADHSPQIVFEAAELAYNLPLFLRLAAHWARFRPDLIYERYALNTFAPSLLARLTGCIHVLEVNDSVVIERSRALIMSSVAAFWEGYCLRSSALAITITGRFKSLLIDRFGLPPDRVEVMTNAVSRKRFQRAFDRDGLRRSLGVDGRTVLGASGQFLPWHGLEELVAGLALEADRRDLHFLFIGDGPVREAVTARAEALGIGARVRFTGMLPIREVPDHLAVLDLAVIPSAAPHASPMKLMEYMAAGLPVVAPDLPSIRAAAPEGTVAIFPAGDMPAMQAAVAALLSDREGAAAMGRRAREHVFAELTWTRHADRALRRAGAA